MESKTTTKKALWVSPESHRELRIEAAKAGVTIEKMVDLALDAYVQKRNDNQDQGGEPV